MVQGQAHPLTIGELARSAGVKTSTLRYYERRGILPRPQRLPNGYRVYGDESLTYLRLIRRGQALGITLKEVRHLVQLVRHRQRPCEQVHALVAARLRRGNLRSVSWKRYGHSSQAFGKRRGPGIVRQ